MVSKETPNSSVNTPNYKEYLETINTDLEKIKTIYADPLDGYLRYDENTWVCITFFWDEKWYVTKEDIEKKEREISNTISQIEQIESWLLANETVPKVLKKVYEKSLKAMKNKLLMFKNAIRIEWEKSGYNLSDDEREKYSKQVLDLQIKIYWERVSDNKNELYCVLNNLHALFAENKDKLNEEYRIVFEKFLKDSDKKYWFQYVKKEIATKHVETPQQNIDVEKLKKISESVINFYKNYFWNNSDLKDWKIVEVKWGGNLNISWMNEELRIPKEYDNVDDEKVTQVIIAHEIEQHLLQWDNTNRIIGKWFSCGKYDWISEWVAKVNEDIASGRVNSLEDLKSMKNWSNISIWMIWVFICENYNYDDALKILTAYFRLSTQCDYDKCKEKAKTRVKRSKRFVPYDKPWASIKDTLYQRWKNWVIDYLTEDNSLEQAIKRYKDLNTFKFWPEELKYIDEIKKELNVEEKDLIYPLFIWRILHDKLNKGKWSINEYLRYFETENDKTWEVWLSHMKLNSEKITWEAKKELVKILLSLWYDSREINNKKFKKTED